MYLNGEKLPFYPVTALPRCSWIPLLCHERRNKFWKWKINFKFFIVNNMTKISKLRDYSFSILVTRLFTVIVAYRKFFLMLWKLTAVKGSNIIGILIELTKLHLSWSTRGNSATQFRCFIVTRYMNIPIQKKKVGFIHSLHSFSIEVDKTWFMQSG